MSANADAKVRYAAPVTLSVILQIASSAYLLAMDQYLHAYAVVHWYGLLAYVVIDALLLIILLSGKAAWPSMALFIWSVTGVMAILGDAASGLALSQFHSTPAEGFSYLFGFGRLDSSVLGTSIAVTMLLLFQIVTAVLSALSVRKRHA